MTWTKWRNRLAIVLSVALLLMAYCAQAGAEAADLSGRGGLTVVLVDDDDLEPRKGETIAIYRVADIVALSPAAYALTDAFSACAIALSGSMTTAEQEDAAAHLASFADAHEIAPLATQKSNKSGTALFSDLGAGLYLVTHDDGNSAYAMQPFVISLPMTSEDGTGWNYEINAEPKLTATVTATPTPEDPLPQTGMDYSLIYWLLAGGALLMLLGVVGLAIWRRGRRK